MILTGAHIYDITSKADKTLDFLRRNMKNCTRKVKNFTYTSLVSPTVEFSSPVLDPYKQNQIHQIEQVQRKAARYVFNEYNDRSPGAVTGMLNKLKWENCNPAEQKLNLF